MSYFVILHAFGETKCSQEFIDAFAMRKVTAVKPLTRKEKQDLERVMSAVGELLYRLRLDSSMPADEIFRMLSGDPCENEQEYPVP